MNNTIETVDVGNNVVTVAYKKDFVRYYKSAKQLAERDGITFSLTINQVADLWALHWNNHTEYRMARKNLDRGFTPTNTEVITYEEFARELMLRHRCESPPGIKDFWQWAEARRVRIYDLEYTSLGDAKRELGLAKSTIRHRCSSPNFPEFEYIDPPRYEGAL